jgi:hypothetical protein
VLVGPLVPVGLVGFVGFVGFDVGLVMGFVVLAGVVCGLLVCVWPLTTVFGGSAGHLLVKVTSRVFVQ